MNPIIAPDLRRYLDEMDAAELGRILIGVMNVADVPDDIGGDYKRAVTPDGGLHHHWIMRPLPNMQFTRDNSAWIFGGVSLNPMYWPAREEETLLTTAI